MVAEEPRSDRYDRAKEKCKGNRFEKEQVWEGIS